MIVAGRAFRTWRTVPRRAAAKSCARSARPCAHTRPTSGSWSRSRPARSALRGEGEVQEMIDMCDFAVGLSRQLYGLTIASERPRHRMMEQWHPLGPVGVITAFNFPVAVWAWNAMIAAVCGDTIVWKPSPRTPLSAIAVHVIVDEVARANGCAGVFNLCVGGADDIGERMLADRRLSADLSHGQLSDGPPRGRGRRPPSRPHDPRARRQQRDRRHAKRRPRAGDPRHDVCRSRDRRPKVHNRKTPDRARIDPRRRRRSLDRGLPPHQDRRPVGRLGARWDH